MSLKNKLIINDGDKFIIPLIPKGKKFEKQFAEPVLTAVKIDHNYIIADVAGYYEQCMSKSYFESLVKNNYIKRD